MKPKCDKNSCKKTQMKNDIICVSGFNVMLTNICSCVNRCAMFIEIVLRYKKKIIESI